MAEQHTLAERIKRWREWSRLSQADLARRLNVAASAVSAWEGAGGRAVEPRHKHMLKMCATFGIDLPTFWGELPNGSRPLTGKAVG